MIAKLLCSKGEIKTGLSSYFVKLRDCGKVIEKMFKRVGEFDDIVGLGYNGPPDIKQDTKYLLNEWKTVETFLQYKYSTHHVTIDGQCKSHCCCYELNTAN